MKAKLNVCVLLVVLSTIIPLIFNTYISLLGTVQTILQYVYAYMAYVIIQRILQKHEKASKIITNLLIISTVILIIVGIDEITLNLTGNILKTIGNSPNGESRLMSVFKYPNVFAAYIGSILFLNIKEALKQSKQETKSIYKTITLIFVIGIILTYSKGILLILPILLLVYIVTIKDKKQKKEIIHNIVLSFMIAIIFVIAFEKLANMQNYVIIWIVLGIIILVDYLFNLGIEKLDRKIADKKNIVFFLFAILAIIIYVIVGLNLYDEYVAFNEKVESQYEAKVIHKIKGGTNYQFEFDIDAKSPRDIENTYTINLIERDDKNKELNQTNVKFGTYAGKKEIQITTKKETKEIKIEFKSEYPYANKKMVIKHFYINQKEEPLKYKYLPTKLVEKVQCIDINYKTAKERIEMIKDAMQIAKESPITGNGGKGWQCQYKEVQNYDYTANKLHSYPAKIILEFGMIGFMVYLIIAIMIIAILRKAVKKQDIEEISIIFAIIILGIHSIIDVDMEYTYILMYVFMLMGIIASKTKEQETERKFIGNMLLIVSVIVSIYLSIDTKSYNKYANINDLMLQRNGLANYSAEYKKINEELYKSYEEIIKYEKYNYLDVYYNIILNCINSDSEVQLEVLEEYYEKILNYKSKNEEDFIKRFEKISLIIKELEEQNNSKYNDITVKFAEIIVKEYQEKLNPVDKTRLEDIYIKAKEVKSNYILGVKIKNTTEIPLDEKVIEESEVEETDEILIYHTHGTESYKSKEKYETYEFYKSLDENYNVIKVGDYLTERLIEKGVSVTHNREYHNYPNKKGTYEKARKSVTENLNQDRNINRIIDIHRDSYSNHEHEAKTVEIEGKRVAPLRFVIGINRKDKNWIYDLKWAIEMQKQANKKYPGLFEAILIREEEYNQDLSKYAVLIEVGENCNDIEEALNSMKYFSEIVAK